MTDRETEFMSKLELRWKRLKNQNEKQKGQHICFKFILPMLSLMLFLYIKFYLANFYLYEI